MRGILIVVTMRPELAGDVMRNYERQSLRLPLLQVANGRAARAREKLGGEVILGPQNKAACLELSREHALKKGFDYAVWWDDDDYYGSEFVRRAASILRRGATATGQTKHYVRTSQNQLWLVRGEELPMGGSLSGLLTTPWDTTDQVAPELSWLRRQERLEQMPEGYYARQRLLGAGHVWPASDQHLCAMLRGGYDLGPWDPRVVDQEIGAATATRLTYSPRDRNIGLDELPYRRSPGVPRSEESTLPDATAQVS